MTTENRLEWLCLAVLITLGSHAVPMWLEDALYRHLPRDMRVVLVPELGYSNLFDLLFLCYGLLLVIGCPARSGLVVGRFWRFRGPTLLVCSLPVVLTALVYPRLPYRPFGHAEIGIWLISPVAQELVFLGFIYGRLEGLFPEPVHRSMAMRWGLLITAILFALWHLPLGWSISWGYTLFQMAYSFLGMLCTGLSRQWTGSILYATLSHMAVNWIAWRTS